jgi:hypothetical protein
MESLDQVFDVLSKQRRRYALYALDQADEPLEIEELAERIRQWESEQAETDTEPFEDVLLGLRHSDLPKADQAEYIEYDHSTGEIKITGDSAEFEIILTVSEAIETMNESRQLIPDTTTAEEFLSELPTSRVTND